MLDPALFEGLTQARVSIKMSPGGELASEAMQYCSMKPCMRGLHFGDIYVEADSTLDFMTGTEVHHEPSHHGAYYVVIFAVSDKPPLAPLKGEHSTSHKPD